MDRLTEIERSIIKTYQAKKYGVNLLKQFVIMN